MKPIPIIYKPLFLFLVISILSANLLYVIAGPTAVGKTAIAIQLAKRLGTDIISADSRQCYKGMTIGTAKPTAAELKEVKHYFIDQFTVTDSITAVDFEKMAMGYLVNIYQNTHSAIVCGGTGLYIKALCEGLDDMPEVDEATAHEVNNLYEQNGIAWLQHAIRDEDPEFYERGEIKNPARMVRALIFKRSTGESIVHFRTGQRKKRPFNAIKIGLELPRDVMYERINERVDNMMQAGLLDEVTQLYPFRQHKNLRTVGYMELFDHLDGKTTLEDAVSLIKQNTRHYAKRQLTWFRKDKEIHWFSADEANLVDKILQIK